MDVRLWHKPDMLNALTNVRFWAQTGHWPTAACQCRFISTRPSPSFLALTDQSLSSAGSPPTVTASVLAELLPKRQSRDAALPAGEWS